MKSDGMLNYVPTGGISQGDKLRQSLRICLMTFAVCVVAVRAQEKPPLKLIATTPMPGFTGDFDHFGLDLKGTVCSLRPKIRRPSKCLISGRENGFKVSRVSANR